MYIQKVFNFDAAVPSKFAREDDYLKDAGIQSNCKHCKENAFQYKSGEMLWQAKAKKMAPSSKKTNKLPSFETLANEALAPIKGMTL